MQLYIQFGINKYTDFPQSELICDQLENSVTHFGSTFSLFLKCQFIAYGEWKIIDKIKNIKFNLIQPIDILEFLNITSHLLIFPCKLFT